MIDGIRFKADDAFVRIENTHKAAELWVDAHDNGKRGALWRSPRFMPRWASRISLDVRAIRCEQLQDISPDDSLAEGVSGWTKGTAFERLWDEINGKRAPWASNPWVWVVTFARLAS